MTASWKLLSTSSETMSTKYVVRVRAYRSVHLKIRISRSICDQRTRCCASVTPVNKSHETITKGHWHNVCFIARSGSDYRRTTWWMSLCSVWEGRYRTTWRSMCVWHSLPRASGLLRPQRLWSLLWWVPPMKHNLFAQVNVHVLSQVLRFTIN